MKKTYVAPELKERELKGKTTLADEMKYLGSEVDIDVSDLTTLT